MTGRLAAILGVSVLCFTIPACALFGPSQEEVAREAFVATQAEDTLEAYEGFLEHHRYSVHATAARRRVRELHWDAAETRAARTELALENPIAPDITERVPALVDELLPNDQFRRLYLLREKFPQLAHDPRITRALEPDWADEKLLEHIRTSIQASGSLQLALAAGHLGVSGEGRVLPYLVDLLRRASEYEDLQEVEYTSFNNFGRAETGRSNTSLAREVRSSLRRLIGLHPVRERHERLLDYSEDESERVRTFVHEHFQGLNQTLLFKLESSDKEKASSIEPADFRINPWLVETLIEHVTAAPQPYARDYCVLTLGVNRVEQARAALVAALKDEHPLVRRSALAAVATLGDCADVIRPLLEDGSASVAAMAAEALGLLGDAPSTQDLIGLLRHRDALVRVAAAGALEGLGWQPGSEQERAILLYASEEWSHFRELPEELRRGAALPDQDDYIAMSSGAGVDGRTSTRSLEEQVEWIARVYGRERKDFVIARSWESRTPPEEAMGQPWRVLLAHHVFANVGERWSRAKLAYAVRARQESSPDQRYLPLLGNRIVDRPLELRPTPQGLQLVPGPEYFAVLREGGALTYVPHDDLRLGPAIERRIEFEVRSAQEEFSELDPCVLFYFTHSIELKRDLHINATRDYALDQVQEVCQLELTTNPIIRGVRLPKYIFLSAPDRDRIDLKSVRQLAEASPEPWGERFAVRVVTADVSGVVRSVDEEAVIAVTGDDESEHVISGLIGTHLRTGDPVLLGDMVGIAPKD